MRRQFVIVITCYSKTEHLKVHGPSLLTKAEKRFRKENEIFSFDEVFKTDPRSRQRSDLGSGSLHRRRALHKSHPCQAGQ